jgi:hypothetical protein
MMESLDIQSRLFVGFAIGIGLSVIGLVNAIAQPSRLVQTIVGLLGAGIASGLAIVLESDYGLAVGISVMLVAMCWQIVTSQRLLESLQRLAWVVQSQRARWALLAIVGIVVLGVESQRFDSLREQEIDADMASIQMEIFAAPPTEDLLHHAFTDAGAMIPLIRTTESRSGTEMDEIEEVSMNRLPYRSQLIKRASANDRFNCHGWVFAEGQHGIHGFDVDRILQENGYNKVVDAVPGDLCIYRDDDQRVLHTAIIRAVCDDGTVLVEGKWGWMGIYLHPASQSNYGENFRFYHTDRGHHRLANTNISNNAPVVATSIVQ